MSKLNGIFLFILCTTLQAEVTDLKAVFRKGKTYITWSEDTSKSVISYNIYRSRTQIQEIKNLVPIATINQGSGYDTIFKEYRMIENLGQRLSAGTGLFVFTPKDSSNQFFYAATINTTENEDKRVIVGKNSLQSSITEEYWKWPHGILVSKNVSATRGEYTFYYWMDYQDWNHKVFYYGHYFKIYQSKEMLPGKNVPLTVKLHGRAGTLQHQLPWAEDSPNELVLALCDYGVPQVRVTDVDENTWWFGYSDHLGSHAFQKGDSVIEYTQQRIINYVQYIKADTTYFKVDTNRVYVKGNSMGGSGSFLLGPHYPEIFAAHRANVGVSNYDELWKASSNNQDPSSFFAPFFGTKTDNLPTRHGTNAYNWTNIPWVAMHYQAIDFPPVIATHGVHDDISNMRMHRNLYNTYQKTRQLVFGRWADAEHAAILEDSAIVPGNYLRFKKNEFFPVFTNASQNNNYGQLDLVDTASTGPFWAQPKSDSAGVINAYFDWTSSLHDMGLPNDDMVDNTDTLSVTIKSSRPNTTVEITPRRIQHFQIVKNKVYKWENMDITTAKIIDSGFVTPDEYMLITIPKFVVTQTGNKLIIIHTDKTVFNNSRPSQHGDVRFLCKWLQINNQTLSFEIMKAGSLKLSIFTMQGKQIWNHRENNIHSGEKIIFKHAENGLANGTYIVRLSMINMEESFVVSLAGS